MLGVLPRIALRKLALRKGSQPKRSSAGGFSLGVEIPPGLILRRDRLWLDRSTSPGCHPAPGTRAGTPCTSAIQAPCGRSAASCKPGRPACRAVPGKPYCPNSTSFRCDDQKERSPLWRSCLAIPLPFFAFGALWFSPFFAIPAIPSHLRAFLNSSPPPGRNSVPCCHAVEFRFRRTGAGDVGQNSGR